MKKYLLKISLFGIIVSITFFILIFVRYKSANSMKWSFPKEKHILFMGASHVYHAIDDSILEESINLAQPSERYMYTYLKLKNILRDNSQIDTVFLQCSSTDLWQDTDYKYFTKNEQRFFVKNYWPFFSCAEWHVLLKGNDIIHPISIIIKNLLSKEFFFPQSQLTKIGGFAPREKANNKFDSSHIEKDLEIEHVKEYGDYGYGINYYYLRKIISICKEKDVKLYLIYFPVYKPELFYDQEFCNQSRMKYFPDVEYIDYSKWICDEDERLDAHHLNYKGAVRFTEEIKKRFLIH